MRSLFLFVYCLILPAVLQAAEHKLFTKIPPKDLAQSHAFVKTVELELEHYAGQHPELAEPFKQVQQLFKSTFLSDFTKLEKDLYFHLGSISPLIKKLSSRT